MEQHSLRIHPADDVTGYYLGYCTAGDWTHSDTVPHLVAEQYRDHLPTQEQLDSQLAALAVKIGANTSDEVKRRFEEMGDD